MAAISIALTTYNGDVFLREQLDSILNQTIKFKELVICDDCSTDSTKEILIDYRNKDPRIKLYFNDKNLGFKANFEKAIGLCSGELIALSDQDDIWLPDHLEKLYTHLGDKMIVCGDAEIIDKQGKRTSSRLSKIKNFYWGKKTYKSLFQFIAYYQNPFQGASMMIRRDFLEKVLLPIPAKVKYHDVWFAICGTIYESIVFVDCPITLYRMHGNNASGSHRHKSTLRTLLGHLLKTNLDNNRREILDALYHVVLPAQNIKLIDDGVKYYRNRSISTRIKNFIFELINYNAIYGKY